MNPLKGADSSTFLHYNPHKQSKGDNPMKSSENTLKHLKLIFGYLNVLKDSISQEDKKWMVDAIEGELRTLFGYFEDIKSSDIDIKEETFKIQPLIRDIIHNLQGELRRKSGIVDYQSSQDQVEVRGIQSAVRQAIKNAIEEGIRTLGEGGILRVVEKLKKDKLILQVESEKSDSFLTLELPLAPRGYEVFVEKFKEEISLPTLKGIGLILFRVSGLDTMKEIYGKKRVEHFVSSFNDKLAKTLRKGDSVIFDDEGNFLVLVRNVNQVSQVKSIMNRLRKFVQQDLEPPLELFTTFRLVDPKGGKEPEKLLSDLLRDISNS